MVFDLCFDLFYSFSNSDAPEFIIRKDPGEDSLIRFCSMSMNYLVLIKPVAITENLKITILNSFFHFLLWKESKMRVHL